MTDHIGEPRNCHERLQEALSQLAEIREARLKHEKERYDNTRIYHSVLDRVRVGHEEDQALYRAIDGTGS